MIRKQENYYVLVGNLDISFVANVVFVGNKEACTRFKDMVINKYIPEDPTTWYIGCSPERNFEEPVNNWITIYAEKSLLKLLTDWSSIYTVSGVKLEKTKKFFRTRYKIVVDLKED